MQDARFPDKSKISWAVQLDKHTYTPTQSPQQSRAVPLIAQYVVTSCAVFSSLLRPVREKCVP